MWAIDAWIGSLGPTEVMAVVALALAVAGLLRRRPSAPPSEPKEVLRRLDRIEETLRQLQSETVALRQRLHELEERQRDHLQRLALIRFRAFPEVGADLSFSLALLDGRGNGVVLTSLFGREETRLYAKPIRDGTSTYRLAPEEEQALNQALTAPTPSAGL
jgi:transposase